MMDLAKYLETTKKELANIKTIYPYFVVLNNTTREGIENLLSNFKQQKYFEIKKDWYIFHEIRSHTD